MEETASKYIESVFLGHFFLKPTFNKSKKFLRPKVSKSAGKCLEPEIAIRRNFTFVWVVFFLIEKTELSPHVTANHFLSHRDPLLLAIVFL